MLLSNEDRVAETAAAWLARRDRGLTAAETRQMSEWLEADPRHAAEFARIEASWAQLDDGRFDSDLVEMARQVQTRAVARGRKRNRLWRMSLATGALAAAAAMIFVLLQGRNSVTTPPRDPVAMTYQIVPSSAREIKLADGSVIKLRGETQVQTEFSSSARRVRLLRGEAHFIVAKDPSRPFTVTLGNVAVRAVGTAFNLQSTPDFVEILVTEGSVRVDDSAEDRSLLPAGMNPEVGLRAGHRAIVDHRSGLAAMAEVEEVSPGEIDRTLAWETVQFIFDRTPLRDAVEAFNRYSSQRLVLGAPELGDRIFGGTCRANNAEGFVRLLEKTADVRAERRGPAEIVLWPTP